MQYQSEKYDLPCFAKIKKQVQVLEIDESKWKELYRESKFKLNTFHLQEFKDKEDKKVKQAEKKRYSEFIDLYEEYLKHSNFRAMNRVAKDPKFRGVDIETATAALDVFWERNKNTTTNNLMVEQKFAVQLGGFTFKGKIDRVDMIPGTKDELEIIDYKAGKYEPGPDERSRQLLLYARGIEHVYPKYKAKRLTLELLALPIPGHLN